MANLIKQLVQEYTNFSVADKVISIPYSIVYQPGEAYDNQRVTRTTRFKHFAGKGTPAEIKATLLQTAKIKNFEIRSATTQQIHRFMLENGIGVDCSGFVYNVLDRYLQKTHRKSLGSQIQLFPGLKGWLEKLIFAHRRVRRCSAKTLTSDLNTVRIPTVKEIQPGDLIRFTLPNWAGKHIAIIVDVTPDTITYAHSGERTAQTGPHLATINITNRAQGLEAQDWTEKLADGSSYKEYSFHPDQGDSVRRLKILVE